MAVAASFLALFFLRPNFLDTLSSRAFTLGTVSERFRLPASLLSFCVLAICVAAGFLGSRDPLSNPLPLVIWTLLWIGLTLAQGVFGNLWAWIDPWYGPAWVAGRLAGCAGKGPLLTMPPWLGCWPAFLLFAAFAWFELIYPAPDDPARLAWAAGAYWCATFAAVLTFGHPEWMRRGEFLSVFFTMVSRFGVIRAAPGRRVALSLVLPGAKLASTAALAPSAIAFVLLALACVSFDGLSKTFFWLGMNGVNPLEFPGRSALIATNTGGLFLAFALLSTAYLLCVVVGEMLVGRRQSFTRAAGTMIWSLVPIALAYHFAHYLTAFLVNGQYALVALSDPFSLGGNLFGTAEMQVSAGIVMGSDAAWTIWNLQASSIVTGHILAVLAAHGLALRLHATRRGAMLSQLPLTLLMIGYTVFGLWLLSTPTVG